jgi:hypothetical protein
VHISNPILKIHQIFPANRSTSKFILILGFVSQCIFIHSNELTLSPLTWKIW